MMSARSYAVNLVFRSLPERWLKHAPGEAGRRDSGGALGPCVDCSEPRDGPRGLDHLVEITRHA